MTKCNECGQEKPNKGITLDMYGQPILFDHVLLFLSPVVCNNVEGREVTIELKPRLLIQVRSESNMFTGRGWLECQDYNSNFPTYKFEFDNDERLDGIVTLNKSLGAMQRDGGI